MRPARTDRTSISPTDRPTTTSSSASASSSGLKKGKFSGNEPLSNIEVSGKIQPGGTASGTIRMASHISPPGQPSQDCDSRRSQLDRERRPVGAAATARRGL